MIEKRMLKEKKLMYILLVVLAVLIAVCVFAGVIASSERNTDSEDDSQYQLVGYAKEFVISIDGKETQYILKDKEWHLADNDGVLLDRVTCNNALYQLKRITPNEILKGEMKNAGDFGLSDTDTWIYVNTGETEYKLLVGDYNTISDEYYLAVEGQGDVFMESKTFIDYSLQEPEHFMNVEK